MFAELTYICNKCGNIFTVLETSKDNELLSPPNTPNSEEKTKTCPQCSSTAIEDITKNLTKRNKL